MSFVNLAYLVLVVFAYAVFMGVLGVIWLRSAFSVPRAMPEKTEVTSANDPARHRKAA